MKDFLLVVFGAVLGIGLSEILSYLKGRRDKGPTPILTVKVASRHSGASSPQHDVREYSYNGEITITNDSSHYIYNTALEFKSKKWKEVYDNKGSIGSSKFLIGSVHPGQTFKITGKESVQYKAVANLASGDELMPAYWKNTILGWTFKNDKGTLFKGESSSQ